MIEKTPELTGRLHTLNTFFLRQFDRPQCGKVRNHIRPDDTEKVLSELMSLQEQEVYFGVSLRIECAPNP